MREMCSGNELLKKGHSRRCIVKADYCSRDLYIVHCLGFVYRKISLFFCLLSCSLPGCNSTLGVLFFHHFEDCFLHCFVVFRVVAEKSTSIFVPPPPLLLKNNFRFLSSSFKISFYSQCSKLITKFLAGVFIFYFFSIKSELSRFVCFALENSWPVLWC